MSSAITVSLLLALALLTAYLAMRAAFFSSSAAIAEAAESLIMTPPLPFTSFFIVVFDIFRMDSALKIFLMAQLARSDCSSSTFIVS